MKHHIVASLVEAQSALDALLKNGPTLSTVEEAATLLIEVFAKRGRVYACGNGGSLCDAMHFAEELTGRHQLDRGGLAATAISDAGHLTCVGNDLGYESVFCRYIKARGHPGNCLVALSTSGTSKNIIRAATVAKSFGMRVIKLSGKHHSALAEISDV